MRNTSNKLPAFHFKGKLLLVLLYIILIMPAITFSQSNPAISTMVKSFQFTFVAQYALPGSGSTILLNSEYDLEVSADSVIAYLPYYGIGYQAPFDPSDGGIKFISTKFDHTTTKTKKGGWDISFTIKDQSSDYRLFLNIAANGDATLQVSSTFRQSITFNGFIQENPKSIRAF